MKIKKQLIKRITALAVILAMALPVGVVNAEIKPTYDEYRHAEFETVPEIEGEACFETIAAYDFEDKDQSVLARPQTMSFSEEVFKNGNVSLHLTGSKDENVRVYYASTGWTLEKFAKYDLSVWIKVVNLANEKTENAYISFEPRYSDGETIKVSQTTQDWQLIEFKNISIGDIEKWCQLIIEFSPGTTGDLYIDDLTMVKVQQPSKMVPKLKNPEFSDVESEHWAYNSIANLYNNGIVSGTNDNEFNPNGKITREEFAKIAVMASVDKKSKNTNTFSDVANGSWYEAYIETAAENGLVSGKGEGIFGVGEVVTRQDAAVILSRIMEEKGIVPNGKSIAFNDSGLIADYAKDAVAKLSAAGFINGDENGNFNPNASISRAEICAIIDRMEIIENRHPDMLYRVMPELEDVGEIVAEATFDTIDSVKEQSALSSRYTSEFGNKKKGCIVLNDGDYENFELVFDKGMKNLDNLRIYFELYVNSQLNDTARIVVKSSLIKADGTLVKGGGTTQIVGGTNGWRKLSFNILNNLAFDKVKLNFEIDGATYGDVYFDDISVKAPTHPLEAALVTPNYKGLIFDEYGKNKGENDIILRTWILQNFMKENMADAVLKTEILDKENFVVLSNVHDKLSERMRITLSSKYLDYGDYILKVTLESKLDGREIDSVNTFLRKREGSITELASYVDDKGIYVEDGKREMVFAAYTDGWRTTDFFKELDGTVIDKMIHYSSGPGGLYTEQYWETIRKTDLKLAPSMVVFINHANVSADNIPHERQLLEQRIDFHKTNPNTWAYYISDEAETYDYRDRIAWHNEIASSLDLERVTYLADNKFREINGFTKNFATNAMGEDEYNITKNENDPGIGKQADNVKVLRKGFLNKPIWHVLQSANSAPWYGGNDPTWQAPSEQQQKNMIMQSICEGATGVSWYAWFDMVKNTNGDMYEDLAQRTINASTLFKEHEDIILSYEDAPAISVKGGSWLNHLVKRYEGKTYLFVGNRTITPQEASFTIEGATSAKSRITGESYTVDENGTFNVPLDNIEIDIIEVEQPDFLSPVAEIKNISLYSGETSYMLQETADGFVAYVPLDAGEISYSVFCDDKTTLKINDADAPKMGKISADNLTFTVVSEDGKHTDTVNVTINRK